MSEATTSRHTTAFLLACAALAVTGALLGAANRFAQALALGVAPHLLAVLLAVTVLAPTIALHLLRRPGAGLLTAAFAGLMALPFSPSGAGVFQAAGSVLVGLLLEAPFASGRYRRFPMWGSLLGALLVAGTLSGVHWVLWGMSGMSAPAATGMVALIGVGALAWAVLGVVTGRRLRALGVGRAAAGPDAAASGARSDQGTAG